MIGVLQDGARVVGENHLGLAALLLNQTIIKLHVVHAR